MRKSWFSPLSIPRKGMPFVLAVCWTSGLLCGVFCYHASPLEIPSLMHRAISCSASIVGLLSAALLPALLSSFFLAFSMPWIILVICFVKAFLFSFVSIGILMSFGSAGWLLRYFLLFSDCAALPVLYWYWLHSLSGQGRACSIVCTGVVALVTVLDYRVIAPFVCLIDSMKG